MIIAWFVLALEGFVCFISQVAVNALDSRLEALSAIIIIANAVVAVINILILKETKKIKLILIGAFIFRMFLFFWDWKCRDIFVLPNSGLDTETFANGARNGFLYGEFGRGTFYSQCIAFCIYSLFGIQRFVAQYTNVLLGMGTILITIRILRRMRVENNIVQRVIVVMAFLPNLAITNSILLRETIMIFLIAVSVYTFVIWMESGSKIMMLLSVALPILGAQFHSGAIAPAAAYIGCLLLYSRKGRKFNITKKSVMLLVLTFFAFQVVNTLWGEALFGSKMSSIDSISDITDTADAHASGGSAYEVGITTGNELLDMVVNTPIRMFYFVMSPLPWSWRGLNDIIAFVFSAAVYGYCYVLAYKELKRNKNLRNKNYIISCLFIAVASALVFAWGVSNSGTALRHRDKFACPYMVLMALCWNERYIRQREAQRRKYMQYVVKK